MKFELNFEIFFCWFLSQIAFCYKLNKVYPLEQFSCLWCCTAYTHLYTKLHILIWNIIKVIYYAFVINLNEALSPALSKFDRHPTDSVKIDCVLWHTGNLYNIQHLFTPTNNGQATRNLYTGQMNIIYIENSKWTNVHAVCFIHWFQLNLMFNFKVCQRDKYQHMLIELNWSRKKKFTPQRKLAGSHLCKNISWSVKIFCCCAILPALSAKISILNNMYFEWAR